MSKRKIVSYDANFSIEKHRGMGKYINSLVQVLNQNYELKPIGLLKKNVPYKNENYLSFGFSNYIAWEQFSLVAYRKRTKGPLIFPYNTAPLLLKESPDNILILHDIIFLKYSATKSLKQKVGQLYRSFVVPRIVRKFSHIITVSEYSKEQIIQTLNVDPEKIFVIPNSIDLDTDFEDQNPSFLQREKIIFHIGGEPDYKNSKSLLYAFAQLSEELKSEFVLKIVGIRAEKTLTEYKLLAEQLQISNRVDFLGYQTDLAIKELYQKASIFVFPSKEEGFGIPIIEAMKYGCPLICNNNSCLPEIAGDAAAYFDSNDNGSLGTVMMNLLKDEELINTQVHKGYEQVKKYSYKVFEQRVLYWYQNEFNYEL